jgi:hypothetical protein
VRNELIIEAVDHFFEENPQISITRASNELGISRPSLQRIVAKDLAFHPYRLQLTHELSEEDHATRYEFANSQLEIITEEPDFTARLFFSDEALFHQHGGVNRHNCRYWSKENPHWVQEKPIHSPHLTVWAGICARGVIGPFFFDETVNGTRYAGEWLVQC